MLFKLIGRDMTFRAVHRYNAAGFIPSVVGISTCGKFRTVARIEDVEILADTVLKVAA